MKLILPHGLENGADGKAVLLTRQQAVKDSLEVAFELVATDRLSATDAILIIAKIIGMSVAGLALRPVGCQRFIAIVAQDEAAQRKVLIEVTTRRHLRAFAQAALDRHEGLIVDQGFMVALAQGDIPCLRLDHSGIDGMAQDIGNPLIRDRAVFVARKACEGFEMPFDFGLSLEAPAGKAFQAIPDDGGQGLIGDEQFAMPGDPGRHPVTDGRLKDPIAVFNPS
nr:hypothetical protein [Aquisalinus luteolus]